MYARWPSLPSVSTSAARWRRVIAATLQASKGGVRETFRGKGRSAIAACHLSPHQRDVYKRLGDRSPKNCSWEAEYGAHGSVAIKMFRVVIADAGRDTDDPDYSV